MIVFGIWFSLANLYKFAKGHFAYKTHSDNVQAEETTQPIKEESVKTSQDEHVDELYPTGPEKGENAST